MSAADGPAAADTAEWVARLEQRHRIANGVPDEETRAARVAAAAELGRVLGVSADRVRASPLGTGWTEVFEIAGETVPDPAHLAAAGWHPLDELLPSAEAMPSRAEGSRVWAVVADRAVLAGVRFVRVPSDPVRAVLDRCRLRSEVRLLDVLELRALRSAGRAFPSAAALTTAAEIESGLGGRLLAPWATGRTVTPPAPLPGGGGGRRLVVAIGGVDGSGKSTLRAALADSLARAGVQVSTVWVRPGMGLGRLTAIAAWGKRLVRQDAAPGVRAMADPSADRPASRRGAVGYVWSLLVCASFLRGVWRQHRAARGVVLYDRHLVDALATLDFAYEGVDLRLQRLLVRALLPRADVRLHLDVPPEVSVARKPEDVLGEHAVRRQLAAYAHWLDRIPPSARLDATQEPAELVTRSLQLVTRTTTKRHSRSGRR